MKVYFPFEKPRHEQAEFLNDTFRVIAEKKTLVANAPTGLGKTASSLSPAISYALDNKKKVFFLTPKSSQHAIALETVDLMNKKFGLGIKAVDLVGKPKLCVHPLVSKVKNGFYEACASVRKGGNCIYYENARGKTDKQKRVSARKKTKVMRFCSDYLKIKSLSEVESLCPYEVTIDMVRKANVIIADYSHIFNEDIRKNIFGQSGFSLKDCIIVVDEAHNLPSRIRDMIATSLKTDDVEKAINEAVEDRDEVCEVFLKDFSAEMKGLVKSIPIGGEEATISDENLSFLKKLAKENIAVVESCAGSYMQSKEKESSFLFSVAVFLKRFAAEKRHTLHLVERRMNSFRLSILPLDPSEISGKVFSEAHSSVLMSGTMAPMQMYVDVLGIKNHEIKSYSSPFLDKNRLDIIVDDVTTRYTERNPGQFERIAEKISKVADSVPGNTIVFFPSFEILRQVSPLIACSRQVLEQGKKMSQDQKTALVKKFKQLGSGFGGMLLAVSGGSIAEGVDFPGDNLKCAIIVGIPFARVSAFSKALIGFYDSEFRKGWDYGYNVPAISRAVQAAGRVIRTERDRGVCIFMDKRFSEPKYKDFFPPSFKPLKTNSPEDKAKEFFDN